jgi:hypothetical protein
VGVGGLVVSSIVFVMANGAFDSLVAVAWVLTVVALALYLGALWILVFYPDRLRDRARAELAEQLRPEAEVEVDSKYAWRLVSSISRVLRTSRHTPSRYETDRSRRVRLPGEV